MEAVPRDEGSPIATGPLHTEGVVRSHMRVVDGLRRGMKVKMVFACMTVAVLLWISLTITGGSELGLFQSTARSRSAATATGFLHQCRSPGEHLMCPTCTGKSVDDCNSRLSLRPCRSETDRCALTKTLDIRGVLEVITKGCVTTETCEPSTQHTEQCAKHTEGNRQSVRCVTCDDVIAGTCSPVGATSSSRYADQHQMTSLSLPSWKIVLWTISVLAALVGVVLVGVLIRLCVVTQSPSVNTSNSAQQRWPRLSLPRYVSFA